MKPDSKCPHCQKQGFELVNEDVQISTFPIYILRCINCKTAISAFNANLEEQIRKILNEI
jgi:hypothetical protein